MNLLNNLVGLFDYRKKKFNVSETIDFEFYLEDVSERDIYDEDNNNFNVSIYLYGNNEIGESVTIEYKGWKPYFYLKVPDEGFDNTSLEILKNSIENKLVESSYYDNRKCEFEMFFQNKIPAFGFTNNTKFKFIEFRFNTKSCWNQTKKILNSKEFFELPSEETINKLLKGEITQEKVNEFIFCEHNIPLKIMFVSELDLGFSEWIKINKGYFKINENNKDIKSNIILLVKKKDSSNYKYLQENIFQRIKKTKQAKILISVFDVEQIKLPEGTISGDDYDKGKWLLEEDIEKLKRDNSTNTFPDSSNPDHPIVSLCVMLYWSDKSNQIENEKYYIFTWGKNQTKGIEEDEDLKQELIDLGYVGKLAIPYEKISIIEKDSEWEMLKCWFDLVNDKRISPDIHVGHNILSYDCQAIYLRMKYYVEKNILSSYYLQWGRINQKTLLKEKKLKSNIIALKIFMIPIMPGWTPLDTLLILERDFTLRIGGYGLGLVSKYMYGVGKVDLDPSQIRVHFLGNKKMRYKLLIYNLVDVLLNARLFQDKKLLEKALSESYVNCIPPSMLCTHGAQIKCFSGAYRLSHNENYVFARLNYHLLTDFVLKQNAFENDIEKRTKEETNSLKKDKIIEDITKNENMSYETSIFLALSKLIDNLRINQNNEKSQKIRELISKFIYPITNKITVYDGICDLQKIINERNINFNEKDHVNLNTEIPKFKDKIINENLLNNKSNELKRNIEKINEKDEKSNKKSKITNESNIMEIDIEDEMYIKDENKEEQKEKTFLNDINQIIKEIEIKSKSNINSILPGKKGFNDGLKNKFISISSLNREDDNESKNNENIFDLNKLLKNNKTNKFNPRTKKTENNIFKNYISTEIINTSENKELSTFNNYKYQQNNSSNNNYNNQLSKNNFQNFKKDNNSTEQKFKSFIGGYVTRDPKTGVYKYVVICDFNSLYPNIEITYFLDCLTLVLDPKYANLPNVEYIEVAITDTIRFRFAKIEGIFTKHLKNLIFKRKIAQFLSGMYKSRLELLSKSFINNVKSKDIKLNYENLSKNFSNIELCLIINIENMKIKIINPLYNLYQNIIKNHFILIINIKENGLPGGEEVNNIFKKYRNFSFDLLNKKLINNIFDINENDLKEYIKIYNKFEEYFKYIPTFEEYFSNNNSTLLENYSNCLKIEKFIELEINFNNNQINVDVIEQNEKIINEIYNKPLIRSLIKESQKIFLDYIQNCNNNIDSYEALSWSLKITANSIFGFQGAGGHCSFQENLMFNNEIKDDNDIYLEKILTNKSLFSCIPISTCITFLGRYSIELTKKWIEIKYLGSKVIYIDTDSVFIIFPEEYLQQNDEGWEFSFKLGEYIADEITKLFPKGGTMKLAHEKNCKVMILWGPKMYAVLKFMKFNDVGKIEIKGMPFTKRDYCNSVNSLCRKAVDEFIHSGGNINSTLLFIAKDLLDLKQNLYYDFKNHNPFKVKKLLEKININYDEINFMDFEINKLQKEKENNIDNDEKINQKQNERQKILENIKNYSLEIFNLLPFPKNKIMEIIPKKELLSLEKYTKLINAENLILTKKLSKVNYEGTVSHSILAKRINERNGQLGPKTGDYVKWWIKDKYDHGNSNCPLYDRMIDIFEAKTTQEKFQIDLVWYLKNQFKNNINKIFSFEKNLNLEPFFNYFEKLYYSIQYKIY